jgi:hypothetical protein
MHNLNFLSSTFVLTQKWSKKSRPALTALLPTSQLFCFGIGDPSYRQDSRIWPASALQHSEVFVCTQAIIA